MDILFWIILTTFLISLIAFAGAFFLFLKEEILDRLLLILVALSAGTFLGGAFLHLLPEAIMKGNGSEIFIFKIFFYALFGFCLFFVAEQFLDWHHCRSANHKKEQKIKPVSYLVLISDSIHNFIDGLIIAGSFIVNIPLGFITALVVALHEIPQEVGDFGILVYGGIKKKRALFLNYLSAFFVVIGGIAGYFFLSTLSDSVVYLLPFAAGNFIYIASSDLLPVIRLKKNEKLKEYLLYLLVFLLGLILMYLIKFL